MNITQMRYAVAVAETRSFSLAAKNMYVTQPTLSQQISRLEKELNVKLFDRTTRSVLLTDAGMEFISQSKKIIEEYDHMLMTMQKYSHSARGTLHIGLLWSFTYLGIDRIISEFREAYPDIRLKFIIDGSENLRKMLESNTIDAAFINTGKNNTFPGSIPIMVNPVYALVSNNNPLSMNSSFRKEDSDQQALILPGKDSLVCKLLIDYLKDQNLNVIGYSSQVDTCLQTAAHNIAVSFLSKAAAESCRSLPVKVLPLDPPVEIHTVLAFSSSQKENRLTDAFRIFVTDLLSHSDLKKQDKN